MCYAIPGKVIEINDNIVTVDYFGETRRARNEFYELTSGDYIYAQGGFVIQKISQDEAIGILKDWQEFFFELKAIDLRLAKESKLKNLYQIANSIRQKHLGNSCCIHGIIEFSNYCSNNCFYCGIRNSNTGISRYRMEIDEIVKICEYAVKEFNFKALVLQSGEDPWYTQDKLISIVEKILRNNPILLILSIGERDIETYKRLYSLGSRGALLRFETSNNFLYEKYRPAHKLQERIELIKELKALGYFIFTGFLIGLPGQNQEDILNDIKLAGVLEPDMFSFGPFIPHPNTPLGDVKQPSLDSILTAISRTRIMYPKSRILVTSALETLDRQNGLRLGLLCGANSLMINVTPEKYQKLYEIYPHRIRTDTKITERINSVLELLHSIGRAPTDLGL